MEKIFLPNKWFVLFCALLIVVWAFLQLVANTRISDEAKAYGQNIFTWYWSGPNWQSRVEKLDTEIVRRTATDAIVKIKGKQVLSLATQDEGGELKQTTGNAEKSVDCAATLTFYRLNNDWILGKVEFN